MKRAVFYVSSHGYGHAVRVAEVIRELTARESDWSVVIRTKAPAHLFEHLPSSSIRIEPVSIDSGVVEGDSTLTIDAATTVERLEDFLRGRKEIVAAEVEVVRRMQASVIVADIPYLAGEIGQMAGVPVVGISNFTWDYIYEPLLEGHLRGPSILRIVREDYRKMAAFFRLPFHHESSLFSRVFDVGLVAPTSNRPKEEILRELRIMGDAPRRRVYVGLRAAIKYNTLRTAAEESPECLFFYLGEVSGDLPENTQHVSLGPRLTFSDMLAISDTVVSKLGYSMLAACVANRVSLLYPPRIGFREDNELQAGAKEYARALELPLDDFCLGRWRSYLLAIHRQPLPRKLLALDGAQECVKLIVAVAQNT